MKTYGEMTKEIEIVKNWCLENKNSYDLLKKDLIELEKYNGESLEDFLADKNGEKIIVIKSKIEVFKNKIYEITKEISILMDKIDNEEREGNRLTDVAVKKWNYLFDKRFELLSFLK